MDGQPSERPGGGEGGEVDGPPRAPSKGAPGRGQRWSFKTKGRGRGGSHRLTRPEIARLGELSKHRKSRLLAGEGEIKGAAQKGKVIFIFSARPQQSRGAAARPRRWERVSETVGGGEGGGSRAGGASGSFINQHRSEPDLRGGRSLTGVGGA